VKKDTAERASWISLLYFVWYGWRRVPRLCFWPMIGYSTRVGAAQDLAELDIDLAAITRADGWKSTSK
jgi:hypothetical protein